MITVRLICHIERCPHNDHFDSAGMMLRGFSLNVSVALQDNQDLPNDPAAFKKVVYDWLCPWQWQWDDSSGKPRFALAAYNTATDVATALTPANLGSGYTKRQPWSKQLGDRLDRFKDRAGNFQSRNFIWPTSNSVTYDADAPGDLPSVRQWALEQTQLFAQPAPLPQEGGFTRCFWVKESDVPAGCDITAAPIFEFADGGANGNAKRAPDEDHAGTKPLHKSAEGGADLEWLYKLPDDGAGNSVPPAVVAYINRAPLAATGPWAAGGLFENGWVDLKHAIFSEDWLAELEQRAAELFDLPGLLVRFLGEKQAEMDFNNRSAVREFSEAVAALAPGFEMALRDLVQTGATGGSRFMPGAPAVQDPYVPELRKEIGLAGDVIRGIARDVGMLKDGVLVDPSFDNGVKAALCALHDWEKDGKAGSKTLDDWWGKVVLPRVWKQPSTPDPNQPDFTVLRAWHAHVVNETNARELVQEQWDLVLNNLGIGTPGAEWWRTYRDRAVRAIFPTFSIRQQQALMHLGVRWTDIVQAIGRDPNKRRDPNALAGALKKALVDCLVVYLEDRGRPAASAKFTDLPRVAVPAPNFEKWKNHFATWIDPYVETVIREKILSGTGGREELEPALQPDAVVLHIADVSGSNPGAGADPLNGVAGFGVMLHEKGKLEAQCLTLADLHLLKKLDAGFVPGVRPDTDQVGLTVASVRPTSRNGIRRALVSYNNEPLTAESPTMHLAQNHPLEAAGALSDHEGVRLFNPYTPAGPKLTPLRFGQEYRAASFVVGIGGTLPKLVSDPNDRTRYVAPADLNAIPRWSAFFPYQRRVAVGPLRLESSREQKKLGGKLDLPPIPSEVHPLAHSLRELAEQRSTTLTGTQPLDSEDYTQALVGALSQSAEELGQSLVLLRPPSEPTQSLRSWLPAARATFRFDIQRPTVDLRVWDRSFEFMDGSVVDQKHQRERKQRKEVWRETHQDFKDNRGAPAGSDATLDDPAVEAVLVRLVRLFPVPVASDAPASVEKAVRFDLTPVTGKGGLKGERAAKMPVLILSVGKAITPGSEILTPGAPDPDNPAADKKSLRIKVREGEVWVATLASLVPVAAYAKWFQQRLWDFVFEAWTDPTGFEYRIAAPRRFIIEVATATLPTEAQLHTALCARAVAGGRLGLVREPWTGEPLVWAEREGLETLRAGWRTEVALDASSAPMPDRENFHWLHRVTVLMQRWRWNGRPLQDAPPEAQEASSIDGRTPSAQLPWTPGAFFQAWADGGDGQLEIWDGRLFGDRLGTDYRRHEATVDFTADGGLEAGAIRVFYQDISQDVGAVYFRYAVLARSRYEGLLRHSPIDSREGKRDKNDPNKDIPEAWCRLIVPCRFDKVLPPPRLKLVLPLTDVRASDAGASVEATPGLLVVLSEPWFLYGGLAEDLGVEVMVAEEPVRYTETNPPNPPRRAELGGDPIVVATPMPPVLIPPGDTFPNAYSFAPLPAYGPIGHTFDTDTLAPEFIHTSFIVPAPELRSVEDDTSTPVRDLSWFFVKLRFRRRLDPAGLALPLAANESEPTAGVWAQFLPPSSRFVTATLDAPPVGVGSLRLNKVRIGDADRWILAATDALSRPVALRATPVESNDPLAKMRFQLWVLLTEPLFDAYGRPNQERFVDFCPMNDGILKPHDDLSARTALRARIVEVQVLPGQEQNLRDSTTTDKVREFFFPVDPDRQTESFARCVRVSEPIEQI